MHTNPSMNPSGAQPTVAGSRMIRLSPVYYGWIVMLAATFGMIMTSPGQTYAVSIFIEHFITDLGISRGLVSTFYTVGTLLGSLALPFVGRRIDAHGPRVMVVVIATLFGLACLYMSFVTSGGMLLLGFVMIRMFGQGSLGLVSTYVVNQWWMRRRGLILGLSGVLVALLGLGSFPNLINWMIPQVGWRATYGWLGGGLLILMVPVGYFFYRSRPETYGLTPDGFARAPVRSSHGGGDMVVSVPLPEENWTAADALRTSAFWIVVMGLATIAMLSTGLTFHMVGIFSDNNLSASAAAAVYVPIALVSAVVNLTSGVLVDRMPVRLLLATALLLQALALWMAQVLQGVEMAIAYGVVLGMLMGLMRTVSSVVWPTYFGRLYLGSITGITSTIMIAGSALGPMPLGIARDLLGSYNVTLTVLSALPLVLSVATLALKPPSRRNA